VVALVHSRIPQVRLGIHCHNDGELAVANSLAAIEAGATHVQGVFNGYGERCGNANLCSVIPNIELKLDRRCLPEGKLKLLTHTSRYINEVANVVPNERAAFVGRSAFAHKGGIHVSAVTKAKETYEHIDPAKVGNETRVLISDQSGVSNIRFKFDGLSDEFNRNPEAARRLLAGRPFAVFAVARSFWRLNAWRVAALARRCGGRHVASRGFVFPGNQVQSFAALACYLRTGVSQARWCGLPLHPYGLAADSLQSARDFATQLAAALSHDLPQR
jgi:hypothetical protein